ncbi:MAG: flagellar biosynthetic protein FliO [Sphingomonadales bacterium]
MESLDYLQFIAALLFVLALIGALAWLARRFGFTPRVTMTGGGRATRRLSIVEVLPVDARRRLILIRRDGFEHLVLLGTDRDTVVESGIAVQDNAVREARS